MTPKNKDLKSSLDRAVTAIRMQEPSPEMIAASRARVATRLFAAGNDAVPENAPLRGCDDVQTLLAVYRRGELTAARALLVRDHLAECATCRGVWERRGKLRLATAPWQRVAELNLVSSRTFRPALAAFAAIAALCVLIFGLRASFYGLPSGQRATVQSVTGALYRLDGSRSERLTPGATLADGQIVRSVDSAQSVLRLADGSLVELGERAEFAVSMRGHDTTLQLNRGQIIVKAAKRTSGHLYVATRDCRVAVTGTVFSVMASLKGSRVSVVEGAVHVEQAGQESILHRGDQVTTSPSLARVPIEQEVAWSRNLDEYLALLHEMAALHKDLESVRLPELRYESRLLAMAPDTTVLYAALPNYGEALTESYRLLQEKLTESAVLRQWWDKSDLGQHGAQLDGLVTTMGELSAYLGSEVLIVVSQSEEGPRPLLLAEAKKPGLRDLLESEIARLGNGKWPVTVVDQQSVLAGALPMTGFEGAVLLVTPEFVALSPSPTAIADLAARLDLGISSSFTETPFGGRLVEAYKNGVSLLVAADLETLVGTMNQKQGLVARDLRYLLFERKQLSDQVLNSGLLTFAGSRQGVASWLAEPGPMGSLDFLTPQASAVAVFVARQPIEVLDAIIRLSPSVDEARVKLGLSDLKMNAPIWQNLVESLGGEVAVALDGPILPQPALKVVVEVQDAERFERAIEALVGRYNQELQKKGQSTVLFEHEQVGPYTYHRIKPQDAKIPFEAHYAFINGYLVMTPSRPMLTRAIDTRMSGENLAKSSRFRSLLPRDGRAELSGLLFQDLIRVIGSALETTGESTLSPEQKRSLQELLSHSKPSLVGFYGDKDRIEMASISGLLGLSPEALALPDLMRRTFPKSLNALQPQLP